MRSLFSFALILFSVGEGSFADNASPLFVPDDCKELLLMVYKNLDEDTQRLAAPGMVHRFAYRMTSRMNLGEDAKPQIVKQEVVMMKLGENHFLASGQTEVIEGAKEIVTIMRDSKIIHITDRLKGNNSEKIQQLQFLRSSVVEDANVVSCSWVKEGAKSYRKVLLIPAKKASKGNIQPLQLKTIQQISYLIDATAKQLHQVKINFVKGSDIESMTLDILQVGWVAKPAVSLDSPLTMVFGSGKRLLPEYAGYQVLDQRGQ